KLTSVEVANNLIFGEPEVINNETRFPIYLNGEYSGPLSVFVELNEPFVLIKNNSNLLVDFENNRGVIAGSGNFSSNEPIAFLVVENSNLVSSNYFVRFNENVVQPIFLLGKTEPEGDNVIQILDNGTNAPKINLRLDVPGNYIVEIRDLSGNIIKTFDLVITSMSNFNLDWNVEQENLSNGIYFVRLIGNGTNIVEKMVFVK
ncbi:MAG: T9SS type A sorting domain-containing protein, partial [Candidatus Kapaibacteriota bacterium]